MLILEYSVGLGLGGLVAFELITQFKSLDLIIRGPTKCYIMGWGYSTVQHYEGVHCNVISVMLVVVGDTLLEKSVT